MYITNFANLIIFKTKNILKKKSYIDLYPYEKSAIDLPFVTEFCNFISQTKQKLWLRKLFQTLVRCERKNTQAENRMKWFVNMKYSSLLKSSWLSSILCCHQATESVICFFYGTYVGNSLFLKYEYVDSKKDCNLCKLKKHRISFSWMHFPSWDDRHSYTRKNNERFFLFVKLPT